MRDLCLAVNTNAERECNDFYATDPNAVRDSLDFFKRIGLSNNVWECCCGTGCISSVLSNADYTVKSTDLIYRGYGEGEIDFFDVTDKWGGDIVTNPPYSYAEEFIHHADEILETGGKHIYLLKLQFLETTKRAKMFREKGLKTVGVFRERVLMAKDAKFDEYGKYNYKRQRYGGGTVAYAWFVFEKGYKGDITIDFV